MTTDVETTSVLLWHGVSEQSFVEFQMKSGISALHKKLPREGDFRENPRCDGQTSFKVVTEVPSIFFKFVLLFV